MNEYVKIYYDCMKSHIRGLEGYSIYADESMSLRKVALSERVNKSLRFKHFVIGGVIVPDDVDLNLVKELYSKNEGFPDKEVKYNFMPTMKAKLKLH